MALFPPQVKNEDIDFGWGVVINFSKKSNVKVSLDWCDCICPIHLYVANLYSLI